MRRAIVESSESDHEECTPTTTTTTCMTHHSSGYGVSTSPIPPRAPTRGSHLQENDDCECETRGRKRNRNHFNNHRTNRRYTPRKKQRCDTSRKAHLPPSLALCRSILDKYLKEGHDHRLWRQFQPTLKCTMRTLLVNWMIELGFEWDVDVETIHLAVDLVDRFLITGIYITPDVLQLVGVTAMFIAM
jgi:hypothetical protein